MIPLAVPNLSGNEEAYLARCIRDGFVSSVGAFVTDFEKTLAEASGFKDAAATSSGTAGLHAALTAVGVTPGSLVAIPSYTFIATANAVAQCGAEPLLIDIDEQSWTMDPALLDDCLGACRSADGKLWHVDSGRPIAAIMPVCTLGWLPDLAKLASIARRYDLPLVLDAAPAIGSLQKRQALGGFDIDLAVFSFNGNKTITSGAGGAILGNDEALMNDVRKLTTTAKVGPDYSHDRRAFNYRMSNVQAAIGCAQMERLDEFLTTKRRLFRRYGQAIESLKTASAIPCPDINESGCWLSGLLLAQGGPRALDLAGLLQKEGIGAQPFWKPMHHQEPYRLSPKTDMTVTDRIWDRVLTLPCSTNLPDEDQELVIDKLMELLT